MSIANLAYKYQNHRATAFVETGVLDEMGSQGWEISNFGPFVLRELTLP